MSDLQFVCQIDHYPEIKMAVKELRAHQDEADGKLKFLEKQAKDLGKANTDRWKSVFAKMKDAGVIDPHLDFDETRIQIGGEGSQLFIEKRGGKDDPPDFIKKLLKGLFT